MVAGATPLSAQGRCGDRRSTRVSTSKCTGTIGHRVGLHLVQRNKLPLQHKLHGRRTALKACSSQAKLTWHHLDVDDTGGAPHGAGAGAAAANVHRAALPPQAAYQDRQQGQDAEYGQEGDARFGACLGYMWEGYGK